jgi:uncharacterized iron-regulated membrane protein
VARFRTVLFWMHLVTAGVAGAIILIMSATGVLLTYEKRIMYWADTRGVDGSAAQPGAPTLPASSLLERARAARDDKPTAIRWRVDPDAPVEVVFGTKGTLFMNRYSGVVLGEGNARMRAFFGKVTELHRYLAQSGDARERGKAITGAANLGFMFLVLSGFYLWWPRNLSKRAFASITRFRRGLSPKARDFNWHNVIGFWSLVPLFIIVLSGSMISYPWVNDTMYRIVGDTPPPRTGTAPAAAPAAEPRTPKVADVVNPASLDPLFARVTREVPDWKTATLQMKPGKAGLTSVVERGHGGQLQKRVTLTADPQTLNITKVETFADNTAGRRARLTLRYLHTGEWFGVTGQTIAGLASLGVLVMIWTGFSLALRRFWTWIRRRRRGAHEGRAAIETAA